MDNKAPVCLYASSADNCGTVSSSFAKIIVFTPYKRKNSHPCDCLFGDIDLIIFFGGDSCKFPYLGGGRWE